MIELHLNLVLPSTEQRPCVLKAVDPQVGTMDKAGEEFGENCVDCTCLRGIYP